MHHIREVDPEPRTDDDAFAARRFVLRCPNATHDDIELKDGVPVVVGRGPATKVKNKKLSKEQVQLTADYRREVVSLLQLGPNPSHVCGKPLLKNDECELKNEDVLCLLYDEYPQICKLIKPPEAGADETSPCKKEGSTYDKKNVSNNTSGVAHTKRTIEDYWKDGSDESVKPSSKRGKLSVKTESAGSSSSEEEDRVNEASTQLETMRRLLNRSSPSPSGSGMKRSTSLPLAQPSTNGPSFVTKNGLPKAPGDRWDHQNRLIVYTCKGSIPREKIAALDIDWTIIGTKTGKVFPTGPDDWRLLYPEVLSKLRQLFEEDYKIVFFTNQRGLGKDSAAFTNFKSKIQNVIAKIGVPVQVYISTGSGINRKPAPGMWNYLEDVGNEGLSVDIESSFFVGDAAGRPQNSIPGKKKKDFSCADRLFALNIGLKFYTPEEFFLGQKSASFLLPEFDPKSLKSRTNLCSSPKSKLTLSEQEVIILVGYPASGKSYFALNHIVPKGYVHISRDKLGTWQKCVSATQDALKQGKSVIVDNTNADAVTRKRYIDCARMAGVVCRCFCMAVTLEHAKHNNKFRHITNADQNHVNVNDIALNSFRGKYQEPKVMEGYKEIVSINFVPSFNGEKLEKLYYMFLV